VCLEPNDKDSRRNNAKYIGMVLRIFTLKTANTICGSGETKIVHKRGAFTDRIIRTTRANMIKLNRLKF